MEMGDYISNILSLMFLANGDRMEEFLFWTEGATDLL